MDPLTPEEVTALEHSSEGCTHENFYRALRTIRDRERERDDKEYARKEWAETAHRVIMERDALLGNPEAVHQGALAALECMKQFEAVKAERDELQRISDEDQEQNDKLMAYARKVAGRRDVHSVYEVLDQVTELQRKLEECERRLNG